MRRSASVRKTARVKLRLLFSADDVRTIQQAANAVWDEVAYDVLVVHDGRPDLMGNPKSRSIRRAEVIEIVCDASRLEEQIRDPRLRAHVRTLSLDECYELLEPAFPYQWYSL